MSDGAKSDLERLSENWDRALAVVAHPDDLEFGAAAAIARWTGQGKQVIYCLVTSGEAGIDSMPPEQTRPVREAEQRTSAGLVGVHAVHFLGFPDGILEYGPLLRRAIAREVRRYWPDVVVTNNFRDTCDGDRVLNQPDHMVTGRATLDAVRDAGNRWVFPELGEEGSDPGRGVRQVWASASPRRGTASKSPTPSRWRWTCCERTRPTCVGSAPGTSTRPSSSKRYRGLPAVALASGMAPRSRSSTSVNSERP